MRNLDLTSYETTVEDPEKGPHAVPYSVRTSVVNLLFNPALQLGAVDTLKQDDLARKILDAPQPFVLLEEDEYERVRRAIEVFRGFSRNDVPFVRRILECPEVKVQVAE